MGQVWDAERIGPDELVEIEGPPEIHRRQAFAKPGLWAGLTTTEPGLVSGWQHHGGHDTIVYVISGHVAIEFGEGGRRAVQAGAGDFLVIPSGLVHRESTPGDEPSHSVVIRAGGPADDRGRRALVVTPQLRRRPVDCAASSIGPSRSSGCASTYGTADRSGDAWLKM